MWIIIASVTEKQGASLSKNIQNKREQKVLCTLIRFILL